MESLSIRLSDRQLQHFCQHAAAIYHTKEFKQLNKEMSRLYKKKGIQNFKIVAFKDSLFSLYLEVNDGELDSQMQLL